MGESYATLVVQPIDLVRAFRVDFCLASVIKWLTKWHMEKKTEYLTRATYYVRLCESNYDYSSELLFGLRMYCIVNGFMQASSQSCVLMDVCSAILSGDLKKAEFMMVKGWSNEH